MVIWPQSGLDGVLYLFITMIEQDVRASTRIHHNPSYSPVRNSSEDHQGVVVRDPYPFQVVFVEGDDFRHSKPLGLDIHYLVPT